MVRTQIHSVLNEALSQYMGEEDISTLDLTGLVSKGQLVLSTLDDGTIGQFMQGLLDRVYKIIVDVKDYTPQLNNIMVDEQTYGAMLEKVYIEPLEARSNGSYELQDGNSIDPFIISLPNTRIKVFSEQSTWEIPYTISKKMLLSKFVNESEFMAFITGIEMQVRNSFELTLEECKRVALNYFIAEKYKYSTQSEAEGLHFVKLLTEYNTAFGTTLTRTQAMKTPEFLRYSTYRMNTLRTKMEHFTRCFNTDQYARFTKKDDLRILVQSDFAQACQTYLQSDVYHNELTSLPSYDEIGFWQGSGTDFGVDDCQTIAVKLDNNTTVTLQGVVAVFFDKNALGITVWDKTTTSQYNGRGEYTNYWNKANVGKFVDTSEQGIVFAIQ